MKDVRKNFLLNIVYQMLVLILPLITVPYVSRVIGATGVGEYSYTYSIVYYFMIFSMLGLNNYGNRTIAKNRDDKKELSRTFKEIHLLQILTSSIMIMLYVIYMLMFDPKYKLIAVIQAIYLISCIFDINWFFFGIEKFKLTVTRNTIIKILSLILIFIFVKNSDDVWIYTLVLSASTLLSNLLLWPFVRRYTIKTKIDFKNISRHFVPCFKLFLPVIAVTIYKFMDKTMIGWFSNVDEVGFYESAEKIISVPTAIITALGTVMLPRMSNIYSKGNDKKANKMIDKSIVLMMFLAFAMVAGLIAISDDFCILFFGKGFAKTGKIIILLSVTILFLSWGNVIRSQYLIPKEMDREYIISAFLGAIINLIMNLIFIPKYAAIGACYGTIAAEFVVMFYQTYVIRKQLPIKRYLKEIFPFFIKSIFMFGIVYFIGKLEIVVYLKICLQVIIGIFVYLLLNVKYILKTLNINLKRGN